MNQLDLKNLCKLHGAGNSGNRAVVMDRMMQILHRKTVEQCTNEGYWQSWNQKRDPVMDSAAMEFYGSRDVNLVDYNYFVNSTDPRAEEAMNKALTKHQDQLDKENDAREAYLARIRVARRQDPASIEADGQLGARIRVAKAAKPLAKAEKSPKSAQKAVSKKGKV